uniref:RNA binding motif single stranded interacting protein 3 n=1 Tax=Gasterosteus aculeatus aculeatus TaxID=481459 RepID=A0AAQ4QF30_GASAC
MRGDKTHDVGISLLLTLLSACLTLTLFFFPETVRLLFYRQLFYFPSSVTPFVEMFLFFLLSVSSRSLSLSVPFCAGTYNVQCCGSRLWKTNSVKEKYHLKKQQEQDPTNLYISNLPLSMDEQELENMLKPFGHVISTRILRDANGLSRGVGFARMESTEKCDVVIQNFNGKFLKTPPGMTAPAEPLLCKFADGGQKKRQTQVKFPQNGRPWPREGESGMALTYDPSAMQNGFYSSPYSISTNRMIAQTSITPFIAASPVSTYQVQSTSWMPHQQYVMQPTGAVITPAAAIEPSLSLHPSSVMAPLTQQMNHMSLGTTGTYMPAAAAAPMQGTYIPQYTAVPASAITMEGVVTDPSSQTAASSQDASGQQPLSVENTGDHSTAYSYQQSK